MRYDLDDCETYGFPFWFGDDEGNGDDEDDGNDEGDDDAGGAADEDESADPTVRK